MEPYTSYAVVRDGDGREEDFLANNPCALRMLADAKREGILSFNETYTDQLMQDGFAEEDIDYVLQELLDRWKLEVVYNFACHLTLEYKSNISEDDHSFVGPPDEEEYEDRKFDKEHFEYQWEQAERGNFLLILQPVIARGPNPDPPPTEGHPLTDMGNAARFVAHYGRDLKFCPEANSFLIWDHRRWSRDFSLRHQARAQATVRSITQETVIPPGESAKALRMHAKRSQNATRVSNAVKMAQPILATPLESFDRNPWLLNCGLVTVDLKTGERRPSTRNDLITKRAGCQHLPDADCPLWLEFINEIMGGYREMIEYLQRWAFYSLTGDNSKQAMLVLYGNGANGKSTFIGTLCKMLGEYAAKADAASFMNNKGGASQTNGIARLMGARLVHIPETNPGTYWNESTIKDITGGDPVTARFLFGEYFTFVPTFKLWIATNYKPAIQGTDDGIWRRVKVVPFEVSIPKEEQDPNLQKKLDAEQPGILNWALDAREAFLRHGLDEPAKVAEATQNYREEMDPLCEFINDYCSINPLAKVHTAELKEAYKVWCLGNRESPLSHTAFAEMLKARGCKPSKSNGARVWKGITLKADEEYQETTPGGGKTMPLAR